MRRARPVGNYTFMLNSDIRSVLFLTEGGLISVTDVQETIWVFLAVVNLTHEGVAFENVLSLNEEVKGVLLGHFNSLSNDIGELVCGQVIWHEVPINLEI